MDFHKLRCDHRILLSRAADLAGMALGLKTARDVDRRARHVRPMPRHPHGQRRRGGCVPNPESETDPDRLTICCPRAKRAADWSI